MNIDGFNNINKKLQKIKNVDDIILNSSRISKITENPLYSYIVFDSSNRLGYIFLINPNYGNNTLMVVYPFKYNIDNKDNRIVIEEYYKPLSRTYDYFDDFKNEYISDFISDNRNRNISKYRIYNYYDEEEKKMKVILEPSHKFNYETMLEDLEFYSNFVEENKFFYLLFGELSDITEYKDIMKKDIIRFREGDNPVNKIINELNNNKMIRDIFISNLNSVKYGYIEFDKGKFKRFKLFTDIDSIDNFKMLVNNMALKDKMSKLNNFEFLKFIYTDNDNYLYLFMSEKNIPQNVDRDKIDFDKFSVYSITEAIYKLDDEKHLSKRENSYSILVDKYKDRNYILSGFFSLNLYPSADKEIYFKKHMYRKIIDYETKNQTYPFLSKYESMFIDINTHIEKLLLSSQYNDIKINKKNKKEYLIEEFLINYLKIGNNYNGSIYENKSLQVYKEFLENEISKLSRMDLKKLLNFVNITKNIINIIKDNIYNNKDINTEEFIRSVYDMFNTIYEYKYKPFEGSDVSMLNQLIKEYNITMDLNLLNDLFDRGVLSKEINEEDIKLLNESYRDTIDIIDKNTGKHNIIDMYKWIIRNKIMNIQC